METIILDQQKEFEQKVCEILNFKSENSIIMQRDGTEQMIIDDFDGDENVLSGTVAYKRKDKSFLLIVTKDSEVNHVESITLKMIKILVKNYCSDSNNKVVFATNLPIEIHSSKAKDLKKDFNFHIESVGFSFCQKNNLEFKSMY